MAHHIALLGDSVFDNHAYTGDEPDVLAHLRALLPDPWAATLCAVDGTTTLDLADQHRRVPASASHLVVSVGGNDALLNSDLLATAVRSTTEALSLFADRIARFEATYSAAIDAVVALGRPVLVCTIYNGNLSTEEARPARVALMMFNDVILRTALARSLGVIDLRAVCTQPTDYANPIEPSGAGGAKIAKAVAAAVGAVGLSSARATLLAG